MAVAPAGRARRDLTRAQRNPWMVALWLLTGALLIGGGWTLWYSQVLFAARNPMTVMQFDVLPKVLLSLAPWLLGVGLACLVGVLTLHSRSWGRR